MSFALHSNQSEHHSHDYWAIRSRNTTTEAYPGELEELRKQYQQQSQVIETMPAGFVMLDGNGIVIRVNKIARTFLDEPILGQTWADVIKRSFNPRADDGHEVSLKDGRRVKLEISALDNQPGQLIMITDLTETRLLQDKISNMQRLSSLGRMVSSLAHQIRTPLSAAMLYAANIASPNLNTDAKKGFQQKLMSRLQDLESQVNDMLLFAKSGRSQVVEPLALNSLLNNIGQAMEVLVTKASGKLTITPCSHDCQIIGNKTALSGAIQNLVQNALQAIPEQAHIHISVKCINQHAYIIVADNGQGIDEELADKIFEPFYTSKTNGTGLGLAVVKSVVKAHHGDIRLLEKSKVSSQVISKEVGAVFEIKIPLITNNISAISTLSVEE